MITEEYRPGEIEPQWQAEWRNRKVFEVAPDKTRPKFYVLEMFPYPSGTVHMGHVRNYSIGDVIARYKRARGFNVLHPMGWDAFGLPAENAAIKNKTHPAAWTYKNIDYMREQFQRMGWLFDWRREVATCAPEYYRWEQLFFLKMLERGLAYRKLSTVNWCPSCNTVLANEQVEDGRCWRCESETTTKELTQWFFKVTDYAEELLDGLDDLKGWPERVVSQQRHWIGRSTGAEVNFEVADGPLKGKIIPIFTTRPDTIFGVTYMSLAPEHPLTLELARASGEKYAKEVNAFVERVRKMDKTKRTDANVEKEGVPLGVSVVNPLNGEKVPLYTANFVLTDYGTGAVMAVPAHDERDHAFALKYKLPIKEVIVPKPQSHDDFAGQTAQDVSKSAYTELGVLTNSGTFSGLSSEDAQKKIAEWLQKNGKGGPRVTFKLRDWGLSRQRYWGTPIPVIHCPKDGVVPVPEKDLPVTLPEDVEFTGEGASPLTKSPTFFNVKCPRCGAAATRDGDTMDTFVESSWYHIRFTSLKRDNVAFDPNEVASWLPIDQYIGGVEHATMHCLYFRFFQRVLIDLGYLPKEVGREPAVNLLNQGIVYKDGAKMSKSKGNIVDPNALIAKYGADTTRLFSLFAAPPEKVLEWSDHGVEGSFRFLGRVWRLAHSQWKCIDGVKPFAGDHAGIASPEIRKLRAKTHLTIKKVTDDVERSYHFNTAISAIMELVNEMYAFAPTAAAGPTPPSDVDRAVMREAMEAVVRLLNPFAPHITEELWRLLGGTGLLVEQQWMDHDPRAVEAETLTIVVQVNGKLRDNLHVVPGISQNELEQLASNSAKVRPYLDGKQIVKTIVVPGKLVNFVVKG